MTFQGTLLWDAKSTCCTVVYTLVAWDRDWELGPDSWTLAILSWLLESRHGLVSLGIGCSWHPWSWLNSRISPGNDTQTRKGCCLIMILTLLTAVDYYTMTRSWNCSVAQYRRVTNLDNLRPRSAVGRAKCHGYCVCSAPRFLRFRRAVRLKSIMWDTLTKSHLSIKWPRGIRIVRICRELRRDTGTSTASQTSSSQLPWRHCGVPLICIIYAERHWRKSLPGTGFPAQAQLHKTWLRSSPNEYIGKF